MLSRFAFGLALVLALAGCTSDDDPAPRRESPPRQYISIYYVGGDGFLAPQIRSLPKGDPVRGVFDLLVDGPNVGPLRTALPPEAELLQEAEPGEGELVLDLNDAFWEGSDQEIRTRVGQVLFTMGGLEEGRRVTLLQGSVPARLAGDGAGLEQPLETATWPGPDPLVQVVQPVPGATVPADVPIDVIVPDGARVFGIVSVDEFLSPKKRLPGGSGTLKTDVEGTNAAKIVIVVVHGDQRASVSVPVTVAG